jgi:hypothetical protein
MVMTWTLQNLLKGWSTVKKLLALFVAGALTLTLTGCPGGGGTTPSSSPKGDTKPAPIKTESKTSEPKKTEANAKPETSTMEGTVVSVDKDKITVADKDKKESSMAVSADAKVTIDGKEGKLADVKKDSKVKLTVTGKAPDNKVTAVEATAPVDVPKAETSTVEGTVVSVDKDKIIVADKDKKESTLAVAAGAKVTIDGKDGKLEDIKKDNKVKVTVTGKDKDAKATAIDATTK